LDCRLPPPIRVEFPPVPTLCGMFSQLCAGVFCLNISGGTRINLDCSKPMDVDERHIVACVARCAWLEEAIECGRRVILNVTEEGRANWRAAKDEAIRNAEAWRVWGMKP